MNILPNCQRIHKPRPPNGFVCRIALLAGWVALLAARDGACAENTSSQDAAAELARLVASEPEAGAPDAAERWAMLLQDYDRLLQRGSAAGRPGDAGAGTGGAKGAGQPSVPTSAEARRGAAGSSAEAQAVADEARFGRARALAGLGRLWEAQQAVEVSYPRQFDAEAVRRRIAFQMKLGRWLMALGAERVPGSAGGDSPVERSGFETASIVFGALVYNDPRSQEAPEALLLQGDCLLCAGKPREAETAYRTLIEHYENLPDAMRAQAGLAEAILAQVEGPLTQETRREVDHLVLLCDEVRLIDPAMDARLKKVELQRDERLAKDRLEQARYHIRRGGRRERTAAVFVLKELNRDFPETESARVAREMLAELGETAGDERP